MTLLRIGRVYVPISISMTLCLSVCRTVSEIFSVKEWRDFETGGRGSFKGHLKWSKVI